MQLLTVHAGTQKTPQHLRCGRIWYRPGSVPVRFRFLRFLVVFGSVRKVPEKVPEKALEALVQSQVRFNRVSEKIPEKVPGSVGAKPSQVQWDKTLRLLVIPPKLIF